MRKLTAGWWLGASAVALIAAITAFHYLTHSHEVAFHNVYRRLYYLPIVLAAFASGRWGALAAALTVCLAYAPHAFFLAHHDPAPTVDKLLEMILYLSVGGLTGHLVEQQRRAQRALAAEVQTRAALERQLIRAGRLSALGHLTSGLAHEIRNPLASILAAAETLSADFPPPHRKHRIAHLLLHEIHRLDRVVSDFLRFARPQDAARAPLDLQPLVREVFDLVSPSALAANITLHPLDAPAHVTGDRDQLAQVILNLALNAIQAIQAADLPSANLRARVEDRTLAGAPYRCLAIEDDGPGIPPDLHEDIFNPYFTTRPEGSGLGLSLASRIVEAHGGFIDLDAAPRRPTVWIVLPLHPHPPTESTPP